MKKREWISSDGTINVNDPFGMAFLYDLYVCENGKNLSQARYINIYTRGSKYYGRILEVVDDVDLFHDRYPDPSKTFFEYVRSRTPDITLSYFLQLFGLRPDDRLKTVLRLVPFSPNNSSVSPTDEQQAIIEHFGDTKDLLIQAFAGSGKTSTLEMLARAYPERHFIYLVFNHSTAESARKRFPENVDVRTVHSFALGYMSQYDNPVGTYKIPVFADILGIDYDYAEVARYILDEFCYSDRMEFEEMDKDTVKEDMEVSWLIDSGIVDLDKAFRYAKEFYTKMEDGKIPPTHSFYLKEFQRLGIAEKARYDAVLLDESQDSNPITYDIVSKINGQKVIIGDRHQKIYGFRNTVDISERFLKTSEEMPLTKSFRFHEGIAEIANKLLSSLKGEKREIRGVSPHTKIKTRAFITRTNAKIIELIESMIGMNEWKTIRDPQDLFKLPMSITKIFTNKSIDYEVPPDLIFLSRFKDIDDLQNYARKMEDIELLSAIGIAVRKSECIEKCFEIAMKHFLEDADVYFTTAHTSKGLEWDEVYLTDDYPDIISSIKKEAQSVEKFIEMQKMQNRRIQKIVEEINLIYVAITRARENVDLSAVKINSILKQ
ncbi:UvrD-helicase domain-containing protein [Athalassotoga saccharophila]|uniref:DNA 3'-5' helicase n=1 Tax=Athalassotoga saccharophila TaxID=1441386 RepID=A0A6N4TE37_9BACT|nr:UvrD-helicase domain-containing protein [Athalassotoga saccharophila]BBJ29049.1 RecBCD enzyme subunit RecB [Athalassotoga saccharophila]